MPIYEYQCQECSYKFEVLVPVSKRYEPENEKCPMCEGTVKRQPSLPTISYDVVNPQSKMPTDFKDRMTAIKKANPQMQSKYF